MSFPFELPLLEELPEDGDESPPETFSMRGCSAPLLYA
jgi:hypothetical protein